MQLVGAGGIHLKSTSESVENWNKFNKPTSQVWFQLISLLSLKINNKYTHLSQKFR